MGESRLKKGFLLAASPDIKDPMTFKSVILLCEHTSAGSFGLMINKPLEINPNIDMEMMEELNHPNINFRCGGPMRQGQMMLLHSDGRKKDQMLNISEDIFLGGDLAFLQESLAQNSSKNMILCFGYLGWGFGELEKEVSEGLWCLYPANTNFLFNTEPSKIWSLVLKNIGGKYSSYSMLPDDLSSN
jgi:putative transcriptional regulator